MGAGSGCASPKAVGGCLYLPSAALSAALTPNRAVIILCAHRQGLQHKSLLQGAVVREEGELTAEAGGEWEE